MLTSAGWCCHFYGNLLSSDNVWIIAHLFSFVNTFCKKTFKKLFFLFSNVFARFISLFGFENGEKFNVACVARSGNIARLHRVEHGASFFLGVRAIIITATAYV